MKCALELTVMQGIAIEENKRKEREEYERRKKAVVAGTIKWCEEIVGPALEGSARAGGEAVKASFPIRFNDDGDEFTPMRRNVSSRNRIYYTNSSWMDYNTLRSYLAQFCLSIELDRTYNLPCSNGGHFINAYYLTVHVDTPDCIK